MIGHFKIANSELLKGKIFANIRKEIILGMSWEYWIDMNNDKAWVTLGIF